MTDAAKSKALREHLDRRICPQCGDLEHISPDCHYRSPSDRRWRDWYGPDGEYLGVASGRTGPDPVSGVQPCTCPTCQAHRTAPGRVEMVGGGE